MVDETNDYKEFEEALRESFSVDERISIGSVMNGTIVAIHGDDALVDVGGKSEAVLARSELDDLGTGDPVEVVVVSLGDEMRVSRRLALERRLKEELVDAVADGSAVEGKVVGRRKGGFDVNISGVRGFCPLSHIDDTRSDDLDHHLGQSYSFKILEYDPDESKLVVSRAALLREEKEKMRLHAWESLEPGAEVEGTVRSITDFGAFVDLGGVDGLVHITELSHRRIGHPRDAVSTGETVRVKVLELDQEKNRISLSIKQLQKDPWEDVESRYKLRSHFEGKVLRKADFGVFVELEPGLDGLLHVSQLPPGTELDAVELQVGETISGWIRDLDTENQRIGLTLREMPDRDPWERIGMRYQEGQVVEGTVENGAPFGVFVELEPGVSALIPTSELSQDRNVDPKTALEPGSKVSAVVLSVDAERRRISLSARTYQRDLERQEYRKHMDKGDEQPTLTGFGQQLANALDKKTK
jgi:small subunit ribosomal protein S1